ncbi:ATP-binding cassette domain-containing protein [Promicromonospora soli]
MDAEREDRAEFIIDEIRTVLSTAATLAAWSLLVVGVWPLATTLVVLTALGTYQWVGWAAAGIISRAAATRDWVDEARHLSGTHDLTIIPTDTDFIAGTHDARPVSVQAPPLRELHLSGVRAVHPDGTVGVERVDLTLRAGQTIGVLGAIGAGKSSLLAGLAGLARLDGKVTWNGRNVPDLGALAGTRVAYIAQVPRVVSGTIAENVHLDHDRDTGSALRTAQMDDDVALAGGTETLIGHRGLRLSGGQTQRLALARALAIHADLLVLDDVSSALDAATEADLWNALTSSGATIIAATSRHASLHRADHVIVLDDGFQAAAGAWNVLRGQWGHLAG